MFKNKSKNKKIIVIAIIIVVLGFSSYIVFSKNSRCQAKIRECTIESKFLAKCLEETYVLPICKNHPDAINYFKEEVEKKIEQEKNAKIYDFCNSIHNRSLFCGGCYHLDCLDKAREEGLPDYNIQMKEQTLKEKKEKYEISNFCNSIENRSIFCNSCDYFACFKKVKEEGLPGYNN